MQLSDRLKKKVRSNVTPGLVAALKHLRFELAATWIARASRKQFETLRGRKHLKLHMGAGDDIRLGWVNTDLSLRVPPHIDALKQPDTVFINHDLRRGLPLDAGSVDLIYSSHFFEHLDFTEGLTLIRESHRVLAPGGQFRVSMPNLRSSFRAYLDNDEAYFSDLHLRSLYADAEPETLTIVDFVNYGTHQFGEHKTVYDAEKMITLLRVAGFDQVKETDFDAAIDPDNALRRRYSFYVEATR